MLRGNLATWIRKGAISGVDRLWGYKLGMWSTPTAARCWTAAAIIAVVVARERAVYDLYALGHRELADL